MQSDVEDPDLVSVMSPQVRPLGPTTLTLWSLKWLQVLLISSVVPPGPVARDQGRLWLLLELVAYTHTVVAASCRCLCSGRVGCRHTYSGGGQGQQQGLG